MKNVRAASYLKILAILMIATIAAITIIYISIVLFQEKNNVSLKTLTEYPHKEVLSVEILSPSQDSNIAFQNDFDVVIAVNNNTGKQIKIDTSADEVIKPPTETFGGEYRQRGSTCTIIVTQDQDNDSRLDYFSNRLLKIFGINNSSSIDINPGGTHKLTFNISPWGPTYGALPSTAIPGPAKIEGHLSFIINGQLLRLDLDPVKVNFIKE